MSKSNARIALDTMNGIEWSGHGLYRIYIDASQACGVPLSREANAAIATAKIWVDCATDEIHTKNLPNKMVAMVHRTFKSRGSSAPGVQKSYGQRKFESLESRAERFRARVASSRADAE